VKAIEKEYYQHYLPQQEDEKRQEQSYRDALRKQGALSNDERKKVDYFNYLNTEGSASSGFNQVAVNSKVASLYPNTDGQYGKQQSAQQLSKEQQDMFQKFYAQFSQQLNQKK